MMDILFDVKTSIKECTIGWHFIDSGIFLQSLYMNVLKRNKRIGSTGSRAVCFHPVTGGSLGENEL